MADEGGDRVALARAAARARSCVRCPALVAARRQVVWGGGNPGADVLVVAGAPGSREDELGVPLTGRGRDGLEQGLARAGLALADVWLTPGVKCLPPGNREATAAEVAACHDHLTAAVAQVRPVVVVALGEAVTKALRGTPAPIRALRGREEAATVGDLPVWLYPVFHPEAAAYAAALTEQLGADLARLGELVARGRPERSPGARPGDPQAPLTTQLPLF